MSSINRGEIWLVNLNPATGSEMQKQRPCVVIGSNQYGILPLRIVVPITEWKEDFAKSFWLIKTTPDNLNKLRKASAIDCLQVRSVDESRFNIQKGKIGVVSAQQMVDISAAIRLLIETP